MKPDIYVVELIGRGYLSVMAKPVSGEWIDDEFNAIANEGICQIVSLLERHEAYEVGLQREKEMTEKYKMEFISYPIPDRGIPSSVAGYKILTKNIYHEIAGGKNTVIHCRAGIGRTGLVAAGVLLHCGYAPLEAFTHISQKRGVNVPDTDEQVNWVISNFNNIVEST